MIKKLHILVISLVFFLVVPNISLVMADDQIGCGGGDLGPFAKILCVPSGAPKPDVGGIFNTALSSILGLLTIIAGLFFFFQFVTAGIAWIGSGGDKNNIEAARNKIFNAVLGLIVVAAAWVLVGILGSFVGLDILNAGSMIKKLQLVKPTPGS